MKSKSSHTSVAAALETLVIAISLVLLVTAGAGLFGAPVGAA